MAVVTLARQVGSGGQAIARLLGERLGLAVVGRREIAAEAARQGMPLPRAFVEFAEEPALVSALPPGASPLYLSVGELEFEEALRGTPLEDGHRTSFLESLAHERRAILLTVASLTYEIAARDNVVIVGGGAQFLLSGVPGVLRVKTIAPAAIRAERLAAAYGISASDAAAAVKQADQEQRDYNRAIFGADWDDPLHWAVTINTETLAPETVCDLIVSLLNQGEAHQGLTEDDRAALRCASAINRALRLDTDPSTWVVAIPSSGSVVLQGDGVTPAQAETVRDLVTKLDCAVPIEYALDVAGRHRV